MSAALLASAGVLLDALLGEPRRWHPLVGFGRLAVWLEGRLYGPAGARPALRRARGGLALAALLLPATAGAALLATLPGPSGAAASVALLYLTLGHRSLRQHAAAVAKALQRDDLPAARALVGRMVSRDCAALDGPGIAGATVESVLENGNDAVFGALFWFALAGAPGAVAYRLVNTLDAMWGYRNARYRDFGWAAARLDDVLNYLPARLTAIGYALLGRSRLALSCWRRQAPAWKSPNAGPVMASGAGAERVRLGGPACYGGQRQERPALGSGAPPDAHDIERALALVGRTVLLWLLGLWLLELLARQVSHA
jgi:adenosylcobinamide-phosphate synthase